MDDADYARALLTMLLELKPKADKRELLTDIYNMGVEDG